LYSMGLVLWELLVGERLYAGLTPLEVAARLITGARLHAPSRRVDGVPPELDAVIERATRPEPSERFESAQAMASALEACASPAPAAYVAAWVRSRAAALLDERERLIMATQFPAAPAAALPSLAPGPGVEGEIGSPMTTLVSAQPKPSASFEIASAAPAGRSSSAPPPRTSVVPPARSSAPPPRTSVVPPARSSAPPPRTSVVPPPRTSVVPSAPGVGSTLASAGVIPVSPADLGDRASFARPFGGAFWSGRWGRRVRSRLGTTLVRVAGVAIGLVFGLLVAKLVLPPAGGAAPAESASLPARLAAPSLATGVAPVGTGADRAPVETVAPLATEAPAPEASAPAPASPRKKRPLVRGRDEDRAPRRERCSPPYVIDADGVRHPKPGCR
ncbi:MAG TPA: hypothetical protein VFS00_01665, partial [Polyangiaceae bacterium]|nr:hypothetical protein [Polyangiaceae bacterium]